MFAKGNQSVEKVIKNYVGIAPVMISAVNPTKAELEKIYDREIEKEPEYIGTTTVGQEGKEVENLRIDFLVHTDMNEKPILGADHKPIDMKTKVTFFLANSYRYNRDGSKVQVINKYGESTWLTIEDAKNKVVPANLNWFDPAGMRPAYIGEEELVGFIKAFLNIPNKSFRKTNGEVVTIKNISDAEAQLDNIKNYFKGDISELKSIIKLQPNNKVKCLFGVRTTDDGHQYQAVYTQKFLKNNNNNYSYIEKDMKDRKANGSYSTTEFVINNGTVTDLQEYKVVATSFEATSSDECPFGSDDNTESPW